MQVTISAGVATLVPDETADTILRRADNALYSAKAKGRNRTANA
jgi:diguanylate cyclase (GGDEF)-like protein